MPAITTISILICSDRFVRYSIGPPTGLPAMKMKPVVMFTKNEMTPSGMNFSSSLMGMPFATPSTRRSTTPTVPSSTHMPTKCSVSQNGQTQSCVATKSPMGKVIRKSDIACIARHHSEAKPGLDEVRIGSEPPRDHRQAPKNQRGDRECPCMLRQLARGEQRPRLVEDVHARQLEIDHREQDE